MRGKARLAVLTAYLAFSIGPASAYTALFAFGDSLSDAGNLFDLLKIPSSPYFDGHFSNGPTWVEDLSQELGLGALKPSLSGGTDFAVGDATTGKILPIDLDEQVAAFNVYSKLTHLSSAKVHGALFTLDIGANDILDALSDPSTAVATVTVAANSAAHAVEALHADGARNLLFYEVPQLGLTPYIEAQGPAAESLSDQLAQLFNTTLLTDLEPIETGAHPLKVFTLDTYDMLGEIVADPQPYGFSNVTDPCVDTPACLTATPSVQDSYLFWDDLHPTEGAQTLLAELAYALVEPQPPTWRFAAGQGPTAEAPMFASDFAPAAPELSTWAMMLIGFAGLGLAGWRAHRAAAVSRFGA